MLRPIDDATAPDRLRGLILERSEMLKPISFRPASGDGSEPEPWQRPHRSIRTEPSGNVVGVSRCPSQAGQTSWALVKWSSTPASLPDRSPFLVGVILTVTIAGTLSARPQTCGPGGEAPAYNRG